MVDPQASVQLRFTHKLRCDRQDEDTGWAAKLYAWREKADPFADGRVLHSKVAVADGRMCFITSANLTGHAMEKNMEAGVLMFGDHIPRPLDDHLRSLIDTKVISPV